MTVSMSKSRCFCATGTAVASYTTSSYAPRVSITRFATSTSRVLLS
jgi:hypothetical protein